MIAAVWTLIGLGGAAFVALAVDARVSHRDLRMEMANLGRELRSEMAGLGQELRSEMTGLAREQRTETVDLRTEMRTELAGIRHELRELAEGQAEMNGQLTVLRQLSHTHEPT